MIAPSSLRVAHCIKSSPAIQSISTHKPNTLEHLRQRCPLPIDPHQLSNPKMPKNPKRSNAHTTITPLPRACPPAGQPVRFRRMIAPSSLRVAHCIQSSPAINSMSTHKPNTLELPHQRCQLHSSLTSSQTQKIRKTQHARTPTHLLPIAFKTQQLSNPKAPQNPTSSPPPTTPAALISNFLCCQLFFFKASISCLRLSFSFFSSIR